ncbi:MAG TPA: 2-hydroxy-3-keto-5-methylthiopentenyl-1-phosphate phosphatase [Planktothrix sp. UBA8407]|nr:2-hydroxy-3-keto-5-methylthiopentenyl-1-phosphate phosphatase [Planktothrix sp. UBA8402]HAO11342.1 2-hydroxy-3-keto-5-methylthiopentenyl-1-phosphate phosphatase [Planktothrix sp. UBA8407]HBK24099.1 2-hydroxy-3-keto-5-methylthiopentenyl-1-phosphate phosphatase [Planktothrix sp. UBA10369]
MKPIIFCDFDGTITAEETFVGMLKEFTPEMAGEIMPLLYRREMTLREGVRKMLESIPSRCYPEIIEFSRTKKIRPGFVEFLDFLNTQRVPFILVSGGVRVIVETVLGDLSQKIDGMYAVDLDTSNEYFQVNSEFEADTELVAKVKVMELYPNAEKIAIGDSVTDLNMALAAPIVFARDRLAQYLDEYQKPYINWDDFFDIRDHLSRQWNILSTD